MRNFAFLRTAAIAAALIAGLGSIGTALADTPTRQTQQQMQQQPSNASPYDSQDFIVDNSNIHG